MAIVLQTIFILPSLTLRRRLQTRTKFPSLVKSVSGLLTIPFDGHQTGIKPFPLPATINPTSILGKMRVTINTKL